MALLWRSSGSAVRLCISKIGSAAGPGVRVLRDAAGRVPVVEAFVVVVEFPDFLGSVLGGRQRGDRGLNAVLDARLCR